MNHFERMAIFTMVENIENQLKGLKSLIAASSSVTTTAPHKVTSTLEQDSPELSEEDEDRLQAELENARKAEVDRMSKSAETHFQNEWDTAAKAMASLDG